MLRPVAGSHVRGEFAARGLTPRWRLPRTPFAGSLERVGT